MADKVVNIFDKKKELAEAQAPVEKPKDETPYDFTAEIEKNKKAKERVDKERSQYNRRTKREYGLNPNDPKNKR